MEYKKNRPSHQVTLKTLAQHLGLTPGTISKVLNNANGANSISQFTKARVVAAARELEYRPNFHAQSLRTKRTHMVGVLVPEIGGSDDGLLIAGIERVLQQRGYLCLTGAHRNNPEMFEHYASVFLRRGVEGVIAVDARFPHGMILPIVAVTLPRKSAIEQHSSTAPHWGASQWTSGQSPRFIERLGEAATETLLSRLEDCREDKVSLDHNAGIAAQAAPCYPPAMTS